MQERESSALVVGGLVFSVAVLRMFAPALPFDWMTLLLILFAAAAMLLPALTSRAARAADVTAVTVAPAVVSMESLRRAMAGVAWQAKDGGLFDALLALYRKNPFTALCAVRGSIALLGEKALGAEDAAVLSLLTQTLDAFLQQGERAADDGDVETLFSYSLRALGMLDSM